MVGTRTSNRLKAKASPVKVDEHAKVKISPEKKKKVVKKKPAAEKKAAAGGKVVVIEACKQ